MTTLRYTLVADGPSDSCLVNIINWILRHDPKQRIDEFTAQVADLRVLRDPPRGLAQRLAAGCRQFPCDILFVHRDAERESVERRQREILEAIKTAVLPLHIPVVPVRMTEAWLLIDEEAIRKAAGNPNGSARIAMPAVRKLESIPDPKRILRNCLIEASELTGRRRDQFERRISDSMRRVATLIPDYAPLRRLPAFRRFESEADLALDRWKESR